MRLRIAATLLTLVACSRTTEGPTPAVSGTSNPRQPGTQPARVCNAQGTPNGWRVELAGTGFAPMPQDVLTETPRVGLPEVTLRGPATATLPRERVFFVSAHQLNLDVPTSNTTPAQELAPGTYSVEVKNPSGTTGQLAEALLVVPPPTLTSVTAPQGFTQTAPSQVQLVGTGFRTGEAPTVLIRGTGLPEVTLTDVTVTSATQVTANVPANTPAGTYDVVVTNPEGCAFTLPQGLVINYVRLGTLSMDPRFGWQRQNQVITLFNSPTGDEKTFSGAAPEIYLFAKLKTDPTQAVEIPLRRVAFVNANTVTAVVPTCSGNAALPLTDPECPNGLVPGGPYELRVKDANGAVGVMTGANGFTVLENPAPVITSISPSGINTRDLAPAANPLVVTGQHFGANARVQLLSQLTNGNILACNLAPTGTPSATELRAVVPSSIPAASCTQYTPTGLPENTNTPNMALSEGLYVVRVQNTDNPAYANYSGLIVTNPSANPLHGPDLTTRLTGPRANFPLVVATDDLGQPFVYALGGTKGTTYATDTLASVERAQVTLFGDLGGQCTGSTCTFAVLERTPLGVGTAGTTPEPRRGLTAVARTVPGDTSYLFVLGGILADGTAVNTVERAQVLKVADAPALLPPTRGTGGGLPAGTFYYRVSAILDTNLAKSPMNPGGETLPSEEYPVTVDAAGAASISLTWACIPNAAKYRIYRTAAANAPSGSELLLDEVAAPACTGTPLPDETYVDNGGRWVRLQGLTSDRGNAAARLVGDTLYVTGGFCSTVGATCASASTLASIERATFDYALDGNGQPTLPTATLGAFTSAGNLTRARQRHSLAVANALTAPNSFTTATGANANAQDAWLLALGGDAGGAALTGTGLIEVGKVMEDGALVATPGFAASNYGAGGTHGGWAEVVANNLFYAGASGGSNYTFVSERVCPGTGNNIGECTGTSSFTGTLNATGADALYQEGGPRYLAGTTLFRAFVYAAGGFPNDTGGVPSATVERIIY